MNYKKFIKAINDRFLRGRQPTKRVFTASKQKRLIYDRNTFR
jgi:hypothetical protein